MTVLEILQLIAAILTIITGLASLLFPRSVMGFTGLIVPGPRGITEIRAILGGTFVGLGIAPIVLNAPEAYLMLGIVYLVIAVARAIGLVLDRSTEASNLISLGVEIVFGILLVI
jgi:hypothetical protein